MESNALENQIDDSIDSSLDEIEISQDSVGDADENLYESQDSVNEPLSYYDNGQSLSDDENGETLAADEIEVTVRPKDTDSSYISAITTNGFTVYCADHSKGGPSSGVSRFVFTDDTTLSKNREYNEPVGEYLKILIYNYRDEILENDTPVDVNQSGEIVQKVLDPYRLTQYIIWSFTDETFRNPSRDWSIFDTSSVSKYGPRDSNPFITAVLKYVQKVQDDYNSGLRIDDKDAVWKKDANTLYIYDFSSFKSKSSGTQDLFGYTLTEVKVGMDLEKECANSSVSLNDQVSFVLKVTNTGDIGLKNIYIIDEGNAGLVYDHFIDDTGKWSYDESNKWIYGDELASGDSVELTLVFNATEEGQLINTATSGSDYVEDISADDSVYVKHSELSVTKECEDDVVNIGDETKFTITVKNIGETALDDVFVKENIPDGFTYVSYENGTGNWISEGDMYFLDGTLDVNASATLIIIVKANEVGNWTNEVVSGSNTTDNVTANDTVEVIDNSTDDQSDEESSDDSDYENETEEDSNDDTDSDNESTVKKSAGAEKVYQHLGSNATGNPIILLLLSIACLFAVRRFD